MDFYTVQTEEGKDGVITYSPNFIVGRSEHLMVRGRAFYAIWDEAAGLWSTDEYDVGRLIDEDLRKKAGPDAKIKSLRSYNSRAWTNYRHFISNVNDNYVQLDQTLTFQGQETKREDYASQRLPYALVEGDHSAWDELVGTLYSPQERAKIEWAIGSIFAGDSKKIQKFYVFYGEPGSGKGTILQIVSKLFAGYSTKFEAKALGSNGGAFATSAFKSNPLVAIQFDGDLSGIQDNTRLNSIISHEDMIINEKYAPAYSAAIHSVLFMGTNLPVKISDAKSGLIRRLIDINPSRIKIPANRYNMLVERVEFELGAIAKHCLDVYKEMGKNYYNSYRPTEMMFQTDPVFNYIEYYYDLFAQQDGATLKQAYDLYKEYCAMTGIDRMLPQYKFREELRNYFDTFKERGEVDGVKVRSYYAGFIADKFKTPDDTEEAVFSLVLEETKSLLDDLFNDQPAQYPKPDGTPRKYWDASERLIDDVLRAPDPSQVVSTTLADIDTHEEHFVRVPDNHIVIDFDLKGPDGGKSLARNLEAAAAWPPTYAELSKSGSGVHLHYHFDGDVSRLSPIYADDVEVKIFGGLASLRRRVSLCNAVSIATISGGLPLKEKPPVLTMDKVKSEQGLRNLIARNFAKEFHAGTKPSIDFIAKILDDAFASGLEYDVSDLRPKVVAFANNSTNRAMECVKIVQRMRFSSEAVRAPSALPPSPRVDDDAPIVFFDVECFPNLFLVCWKYDGSDTVVRMINPTPAMMEDLFKLKLVGFFVRRYDNHMIYACYMGFNNEQLYQLSQKLIAGERNSTFAAAYSISYADIWDFSSLKQSLKKFEIDLGLKHMELDHPWDQPVPKELWKKVEEYCVNDVLATEATFHSREEDFMARKILAELSGLTVNDPTAKHTAQIIFEGDKNPQASFVYTNLANEFEGYVFDSGKSTYQGEVVGEGGYVYAEPGIYKNVALLDVASMHPTSIVHLNMFGQYTQNYQDLIEARLAIKRGDYDAARTMLGGKLAPFLNNEKQAKKLSYALKIIINIVYGLTSATFDSPFRDKRNKDNIAAKRGALFMVDLIAAAKAQNFEVVHVKTDSIKIANATPAVIDFVTNFGDAYGYTFEHETTYDKFCLVNDAVYVAREGEEWHATGAQFRVPYVFKNMFSGEAVTRRDLGETKQVTRGHMVLRFDSGDHFIGKTGRFVPVKNFGGKLLRISDGKEYAVTGTKGHLWMEQEMAENMVDGKGNRIEPDIDYDYFDNLIGVAKNTIAKFGDYEEFIA